MTDPTEISRDRLVELERFAAIGRLSAGLLHEISNPLTAAILWLEQCSNHHSPHTCQVRNSIGVLQRYVEAARQQIRRGGSHGEFMVRTELDQVKHLLAPLARRRGIQLGFSLAGRSKLHGDPVKFQQIIANLVRNAIDSYDTCPAGGYRPVRVDLKIRRNRATIVVGDRGCGIERSQLERLFEPFYSTKDGPGCGLGIGLFAVKRSIEQDFAGSISVKSSKGRGTSFIVRMPARQEPT